MSFCTHSFSNYSCHSSDFYVFILMYRLLWQLVPKHVKLEALFSVKFLSVIILQSLRYCKILRRLAFLASGSNKREECLFFFPPIWKHLRVGIIPTNAAEVLNQLSVWFYIILFVFYNYVYRLLAFESTLLGRNLISD